MRLYGKSCDILLESLLLGRLSHSQQPVGGHGHTSAESHAALGLLLVLFPPTLDFFFVGYGTLWRLFAFQAPVLPNVIVFLGHTFAGRKHSRTFRVINFIHSFIFRAAKKIMCTKSETTAQMHK